MEKELGIQTTSSMMGNGKTIINMVKAFIATNPLKKNMMESLKQTSIMEKGNSVIGIIVTKVSFKKVRNKAMAKKQMTGQERVSKVKESMSTLATSNKTNLKEKGSTNQENHNTFILDHF